MTNGDSHVINQEILLDELNHAKEASKDHEVKVEGKDHENSKSKVVKQTAKLNICF